ncbi:hypothetical protein SAMN05518872_108244 [Psychrobacillus sp. OK032]|nr:hypothetical protein SAMN05518872_108244 [Psychrobacillus sp. OK032]
MTLLYLIFLSLQKNTLFFGLLSFNINHPVAAIPLNIIG